MEQKRVSFKVAKYLKEVGYPQVYNCDKYVTEQCKGRYIFYTPNPDCTSKDDDNEFYDLEVGEYVDHNMYSVSVAHSVNCPTYVDAWLWLWREKKIYLEIEKLYGPTSYIQSGCVCGKCGEFYTLEFADPEEAIIEAIEYIVDNNLIK